MIYCLLILVFLSEMGARSGAVAPSPIVNTALLAPVFQVAATPGSTASTVREYRT